MNNLIKIVQYIVSRSTEVKDKYTDNIAAPLEFACIFCQSEEEYKRFTNPIETLGKVVERTQSGLTYLLDNPIETVAGPLRLVKIRKPDTQLAQRGDADFNTNYKEFKKRYENDPKFELVKRESFEMLRLSSPNSDVMACFSNIPKSKSLGIQL